MPKSTSILFTLLSDTLTKSHVDSGFICNNFANLLVELSESKKFASSIVGDEIATEVDGSDGRMILKGTDDTITSSIALDAIFTQISVVEFLIAEDEGLETRKFVADDVTKGEDTAIADVVVGEIDCVDFRSDGFDFTKEL